MLGHNRDAGELATSSQKRDRVKLAFEERWLLYKGQFTIKIEHLRSQIEFKNRLQHDRYDC